MKKPILISGGVLLGIVAVIGWSVELPHLEETIGAYDLLFKGGLIGIGLGAVIGFLLAVKEKSFIAKFQAFATSLILFTLIAALLGHYSNRKLSADQTSASTMTVKQVTATWNGRGLSREAMTSPPDGYYIFVETDQGTIRLFRSGSTPPDIGPSRTIEVQKQEGFWGYPLYSISVEDQSASY